MKMMYESMKMKVESVVERGNVSDEYISNEEVRQVLSQYWAKNFSRQNHPSIIQVLLNSKNDIDNSGRTLPNLVYISREKSKTSPHQSMAGALNTLIRVSASMSNAPLVLTLDCDMYSNDPSTVERVLCYFWEKTTGSIGPNYGYIQFPQRYHGLNRADIYASQYKRLFLVNAMGLDGLRGPNHVGTGCFFHRRVFFGGPSSYLQPEIPELSPSYIVEKPINGKDVIRQAHLVANWGCKIGFLYGSLVEDYYTGYRLQCEGWKSALCDPSRAAFLGDVPITIIDSLSQVKRWSVGLLEVAFSKYSPLTYGVRKMGILMGLCYAHYAFWPIWSIPIAIYTLLPSLALLHGFSIFPKVTESWFFIYAFLFIGAYGEDFIDFMCIGRGGTFERWWNDQRMWLIRGHSSFPIGIIEFISKHLGLETHGFNVTSKLMDDEQIERYQKGMFEFGVESPMFVCLATAAILNLIAFLGGVGKWDIFFIQIFISGFGVFNSEDHTHFHSSSCPTIWNCLPSLLNSHALSPLFFFFIRIAYTSPNI